MMAVDACRLSAYGVCVVLQALQAGAVMESTCPALMSHPQHALCKLDMLLVQHPLLAPHPDNAGSNLQLHYVMEVEDVHRLHCSWCVPAIQGSASASGCSALQITADVWWGMT
jgi:hypothetical protein